MHTMRIRLCLIFRKASALSLNHTMCVCVPFDSGKRGRSPLSKRYSDSFIYIPSFPDKDLSFYIRTKCWKTNTQAISRFGPPTHNLTPSLPFFLLSITSLTHTQRGALKWSRACGCKSSQRHVCMCQTAQTTETQPEG